MEKVKFEGKSIEEISEILKGGIRIRKYEASDLISGKKWKGDNAVLPNSMWSNTFAQEGMEFYYGKDGRLYTNEVIYLDFESCLLSSEEDVKRSIGYVEGDIRALEEEVDNLYGSENDLVEELVEDLKEKINGKKEYMDKLKAKDKDDFTIEESLRVSELRKKLYLEGFVITREEENGTIYEDIYRVIFQNSSKSRLGKTIWVKDTITKINKKGKRKVIREGMVKRIHSRMSMGITDKLTEKDVIDLVSLEAYTALSQSAITNGYLKLDVDSILVVKDYDQKINFNAVSVDKDLIPRYIDNYEGKNTLWDGEMLGDSSLFVGETEKYDMVLLRQCYFKSAMFKCSLVDYIKSFCAENGIDYETATVKDMFGNNFKVKDIRAITTDNSCKWLKFTKTMFKTDKEMFEHFKSVVKNEWKDLWAVVKHDCGTKYGSLVKMSYQMTNSLVLSDNKEVALEELKSIVKPTESYLRELQCDIEVFKNNLKVLHKNEELAEMYLDLLEVNSEVENTKEFQKFRRETINSIKTKAENGEILLNGNNLTLCGNPVELVEYALTGKFESSFGEDNVGAVKCYTKRFGLGEELVGMRSPQNYKSGLVLLKNIKSEKVERLFLNLGNNVVIVDSLQYPVQDSWNGAK